VWCNGKRVGWPQLARQVHTPIDWLKSIQLGIVLETKERRMARMSYDWSVASSRGDVRFEMCTWRSVILQGERPLSIGQAKLNPV